MINLSYPAPVPLDITIQFWINYIENKNKEKKIESREKRLCFVISVPRQIFRNEPEWHVSGKYA